MTLTFVSNYINHHQIPLSNELFKALGHSYHFIQVMPMEKERADMGWSVNREELPYLLCYYEEEERCKRLIDESDIVVFGGVEDESYIQSRLKSGRILIRYSERLYREGQWKAVSPRGLIKKYRDHIRYRDKNVYLLSTGAYTASDFSIIRAYPGKMYKWGYFTEFIPEDVEALLNNKGYIIPGETGRKVPEILFAGRFISLKHPEYPIGLAKYLRSKGLPFHLTMIGDGEIKELLEKTSQVEGLGAYVSFEGFKSPKEVREYMKKANIFLMTSNHLEGWGAVINEAMNSGCSVIAGSKTGAVPYLIRHNKNGLVYKDGSLQEFLTYGESLVRDSVLRQRLGKCAYETIKGKWNPEFAAKSLIDFAGGLLEGKTVVNPDGPLSPAPIIFPPKGYDYVRRGEDM